MTQTAIIAAAVTEIKAKSGYQFGRALLEEIVAKGLEDGDRIPLGGNAFATLSGDVVIFSQFPNKPGGENEEKEVNRLPLSALSAEQKGVILKCKAIVGCQSGYSMGTPKI